MHCNLRPPEPRQSFPALITTPCQVWSHGTYPLPYYSVFAADTLLYFVTLTFDLWPWIFAAYRLRRDKTIYQTWTQSSNPGRSYCDFSIWPYDLKHCFTCCAVLGSGIIFTKFYLRKLIRAWIIIHLSRCDLDLWPLDVELLQHFRCYMGLNSVQNLSEIE